MYVYKGVLFPYISCQAPGLYYIHSAESQPPAGVGAGAGAGDPKKRLLVHVGNFLTSIILLIAIKKCSIKISKIFTMNRVI